MADTGFSSKVTDEKLQATQEGLQEQAGVLTLDIEDSKLIEHINGAISRGRKLYEELRGKAEENESYWKGDQLDESQLKRYQSKIVNNVIFRNTETLVSMIAKRPPELTFYSSNREYGQTIREWLQGRWEVYDKMQRKGRQAIRHSMIDYVGVAKLYYDPDVDEVKTEVVQPKKIIFDPNATGTNNCDFVAQFVDQYTAREVIKMYPEAEEELLNSLGIQDPDREKKKMGAKLTFVEFWTPDFVVWKYKDVILDKRKNPNYNWDEEANVWTEPRVPYIFYGFLKLGDKLCASTSLIEQTISMQDNVNKRIRQISDNADRAQGTLAGSGDGISKEEFEKITEEPGEKVWFETGPVNQAIARIGGNPLPSYCFEDLAHTEQSMDSLFGTHSTTRGEREKQETASGRIILKRSDLGRADDPISNYEDFCEEWYAAILQMAIVHFTTEHRYSFDEDADFMISKKKLVEEFSTAIVENERGEEIEEQEGFVAPVLMVKPNSTMPVDQVAQRSEAINLWGAAALDPITLYDKLGWPNPEEKARRLFLWQNAPQALFPELAQMLQGGGGEAPQGALEDFAKAIEGEDVGINREELSDPETAKAHLRTHKEQMKGEEFKNADPAGQENFIRHVKAEVSAVKNSLGPEAQREQPAQRQPMQGGGTIARRG